MFKNLREAFSTKNYYEDDKDDREPFLITGAALIAAFVAFPVVVAINSCNHQTEPLDDKQEASSKTTPAEISTSNTAIIDRAP